MQQLARERRRHPLQWGSSVAGYLHAGETYEEAARRRGWERGELLEIYQVAVEEYRFRCG